MKQPDVQTKAALHTLPVAQPVPSARLLHAVVLTAGWQLWQVLAGLTAPEAMILPPMKHPSTHALLALQTLPVAQSVPSGKLVQALRLVAGAHAWHTLAGSGSPGAYVAPLMKQPDAQVPPM